MNNFSFLTTYVLRTATLPVSIYTKLVNHYSTQNLFDAVESFFIKNAIFLASPELIREYEKYKLNPEAYPKEKAINLELSLLKYIARMSCRATPFGLFAGCSTGYLTNETKIILQDQFKTHTQFDMQFWIELLQKLSQNKNIQKELIFFPNTSLYTIGDFYRYVEYKYVNNKREHSIASIRKNSYLEIILEKATSRAKIECLANLIIDSEGDRTEAIEFIRELIDNQILVSNIEPTITGNNEVERVVSLLNNCADVENIKLVLKSITETVNSLNNPTLFNYSNTNFIQDKVKELHIKFEEKYILQTDLYTSTINNTLNHNLIKKLIKAISFLGTIQDVDVNENLESFKAAFLKRYDQKEMPLSLVLDTESGIGYLQNAEMNDSHLILDKFTISKKNKVKKKEFWSSKDYVLEKKLQECVTNQEDVIFLKEEDFKSLKKEKRVLPPTFSAMVEVLQDKNEEIVVLDSLGNCSATKLIGRFCNGDASINKLANEIIEKELLYNENVIRAEIAHIPESRTGNILRRPILRTFEIPYLSNSILPEENQVEIDDLVISVKNNRIFLRSKKLNKEIVPCLSNAHNYMSNALPTYQFLCELQGQDCHPIQKFTWGILNNHYTYFPRVLYQDIILSKAKWIISKEELKPITCLTDFQIWRNSKKLPKHVNIVSGDNTLMLDLEKEICFKLFTNTLKNKSKITLEEFLFSENSVVKNEQHNHFVNQFVISFFSNN